jgi:hypothetical protein
VITGVIVGASDQSRLSITGKRALSGESGT